MSQSIKAVEGKLVHLRQDLENSTALLAVKQKQKLIYKSSAALVTTR